MCESCNFCFEIVSKFSQIGGEKKEDSACEGSPKAARWTEASSSAHFLCFIRVHFWGASTSDKPKKNSRKVAKSCRWSCFEAQSTSEINFFFVRRFACSRPNENNSFVIRLCYQLQSGLHSKGLSKESLGIRVLTKPDPLAIEASQHSICVFLKDGVVRSDVTHQQQNLEFQLLTRNFFILIEMREDFLGNLILIVRRDGTDKLSLMKRQPLPHNFRTLICTTKHNLIKWLISHFGEWVGKRRCLNT